MSTIPENPNDKIAALLAPMLKQRLFVALSIARATAEQMSAHVAEHLEYMNGLEAEGLLFASGPFIQTGVLVGDGLTILQTKTIEEARALMENEPLIKLGLRTFDLRPWELREGQIAATLNVSTSRFSLEKS
ncbi:YciI family protein [Granulicella sp. L60]|uniref:YciI family protein n=1 Tax=Granulicella sp. L60 TaxID=1641866 RepID=UPI00131D30E1|nr:YciI family protein [Granulicella sp. L60]